MKENDHQDKACFEQSIIDHVKELEQEKVVALAREEDHDASGFMDGVGLEAFKNDVNQEVKRMRLFGGLSISLTSDENISPQFLLSHRMGMTDALRAMIEGSSRYGEPGASKYEEID